MMDNHRESTWHPRAVMIYYLATALLGVLIGSLTIHPGADWQHAAIILLSAFFIGFLLTFPIDIFNLSFSLTPTLFMGIGLAFTPQVAVWAAFLGAAGSVSVNILLGHGPKGVRAKLLAGLYEFGLMMVPFGISNLILPWQADTFTQPVKLIGVAGIYIASHTLLVVLGILLISRYRPAASQVGVPLIMVELLPLPFLWVTATAGPYLGITTLTILGGVPVILSVFLHDAAGSRAQLERRIQDLSLLNRVGEMVRHTTDLDSLLHTLHTSTTDLLGVGNFYVALYDASQQSIWYPIAIKQGKQQNWAARPATHRLTDQVIEGKQAIMITGDVDDALKKIGAPLGDGGLSAWLGVPLQTPNGLSGCLAVFSDSPDRTFTEDDQILLTALSGQVSAAVENALRIEHTGEMLSRQAEQLNILQQIGRQLAATLNEQEVFQQLLQYAVEFTHSPAGRISSYNPFSERYEAKAQTGTFQQPQVLEVLTQKAAHSRQPEMDTDPQAGWTQMSVPIIYQDEIIGAIHLESDLPDDFSANTVRFISQLAQQAALAMKNATLYEEAQQRLREQTILYTISTRLVSEQDLDAVLSTAVQSIGAALNSPLTGIYLWESDNGIYKLTSTMQRGAPQGMILPANLTQEDIDTQNIARLANIPPDEDFQVSTLALKATGERIGQVVYLLPAGKQLRDSDRQMIEAIAAQSTNAIQNAQLFRQVSVGRDRLQAVLNAVSDGILMVTAVGRVLFVNAPFEQITGVTAAQLTGKVLESLPEAWLAEMGFTPESARQFIQQRFTLGETSEGPLSYQRDEYFYERYTAPVLNQTQQVIGWLLLLRDVTDAQQLKQTRDMLTETLVHDLRSPLGTIKTALELLENGLTEDITPDDSRQTVEIANRAASRVLGLINSLMEISHLESRQVELKLQSFQIGTLIVESIKEIQPQANDDRIILHSDVADNLPAVLADPAIVQRVLTNLIDNGLKFSPAQSTVTIQAQEIENGKVQIQVCDHGPGIPAQFREEVFGRFVQVPGVSGRRRGAGLGLAFCRVAIAAHNEQIWIEDGENGTGTTVRFTLPLDR